MKTLKECIDLLYKSRSKSPQYQLELIQDIKRRGFLKQVLDVTMFAAFTSTCCAIAPDYVNSLPDIGDADRSTLSPADADFLGRQVVQEIASQGDMLYDFDVLAYINDIGDDLVSYSPLAGQTFNFYMIKDKETNAFALPGGYICLYNGLIYTTRSEAELSSVMSHEIGHVVQHHIFRNIAAYSRNQWLSLAGLLAGGLLAPINPGAAIIAANSGQGIATQNMLSFSRDFEREADRVGQKIMYQAGFDPHAMPSFFERLQDQNRFNENDALAFLQTHPVTSQRISEAETRASQLPVKMRPDSPSFLLVREKCRTRQIGIAQAITFYQTSIKSKKYTSLDAQYYGLAFAKYADKKAAESLAILNKMADPQFKNHPATLSLYAMCLAALKNYSAANKIYTNGLDDYPNYKNLWIGQVDLYLNSKQLNKASQRLDELSQLYPNDLDVWDRQVSLYSDANLNNLKRYHYAFGNLLYLNGNYKGALDQYQIAIKDKSKDAVLNDLISSKILDTQNQIKLQSKFT